MSVICVNINNGDKFYHRKPMWVVDEKLIINQLGPNVSTGILSWVGDYTISWTVNSDGLHVAVQAYSCAPPSTPLVGQPRLQAHPEDGMEEWHRAGKVPARFVQTLREGVKM